MAPRSGATPGCGHKAQLGDYQPPLAGGRGGGGGYAQRKRMKQEQAWGDGQDTRGEAFWPRDHRVQTEHRDDRKAGGRGGGERRATFGEGRYADPAGRSKTGRGQEKRYV